ncbi:phage tail length tape measure family protein [Novosphingobium sp. YJ-S2-02]|uniref:Phage tail length tape measure family protein n=1 Tax=Novosphingobium aureum TaxID=2792964 RepID=A0A931HD54_9SPHN|nr:phage tail length tape measure family protein [Novosphingobium aureum]MBH0113263.1 phage tail length tape measure family protein [Novosphingobium aureum]
MAKRDVDLVIRAKDEASKAFERAAGAIERLVSLNARAGASASSSGSEFEQMALQVLNLDRAMAKANGRYDDAAQGLARQATEIVDYNARLSALRAQMQSAGEAADVMRTQIVTASLDGGDTAPYVARLQAAQEEMARLGREAGKLERTLAAAQSSYSRNADALGDVEAGLRAMGAAASFARRESEDVTRSMEQQEKAARKSAAVLQTVEASTGVTRDRGDYDQLVAQIEEADAVAQKAAARAEAVEREKAAATAETNRRLVEQGRLQAALASIDQRAGGAKAADTLLAEQLREEAELARTTERAAEAEEKKTAAATETNRRLVEQGRLQAAIASLDQRAGGTKAADTLLAEQLREEDAIATASEKAAAAEAQKASAAAETNRRLVEQGRLQAAIADLDRTGGGPRAADTALADMLREEAEAAKLADRALREETEALALLRAQIDPLAAIEARLAEETRKLARWHEQGKIEADEYQAALKLLRAEADRAARNQGIDGIDSKGRPSFMGLTPYQLTNLSYQINDIFTQLASGTSLMQTLAQQGGQIVQIFPRVGAAIATGLTSAPVLAITSALGVLFFAIKRAADEAERLREIQGTLTIDADGPSRSAETLSRAATAIDDYGASAEDALAAVRTFIKEGVDDSRMEQFGRVAQDTADVLGVEMVKASEDVSRAFTGSYESVKELDESLNFLTSSERELIRSLFEEGRATEARNTALDIYARKMDEAASKMRGPWGDAARELKGAWSEFLDLISDSEPFEEAGRFLETIARNAAAALRRLRGTETAEDITQQISQTRAQIASVEKQLEGALPGTRGGLEAALKGYKEQETSLKQQLAAIESQNVALEDQGDTLATNQQRTEKATDDLRRATSAAKELSKQTLSEVKTEAGDAADKYLEENFRFASEAAKAEYRREKIAEATAKWYEKQAEAAEKIARAREREIRQFNSRVIGAEGGAAKNPNSSAQGYGQFIETTWIDQFSKVYKEQAETLSRENILALRNNKEVASGIIDNYARENAKFLESFGAQVTAGNLYLAHFLGGAGAKAVLTADGATPVDQIIRAQNPKTADQVLSGNKSYLRTEGGKGRYRTADELETFIAGRVGDTGREQTSGQVAIARLEDDRAEKQDRFNLAVSQENDERQRTIDSLTAQAGLRDTALIAAQKVVAVDRAEAELREKIARTNENLKPGQEKLVLTEEQITRTRELAAAEFDLQTAQAQTQARLTEVQRPVDDLVAQRDALRDQADLYRDLGQTELADALTPQIQQINSELIDALETLKAFYNGLSELERVQLGLTADGIAAITTQIETAQQGSTEWLTYMGISGRTIAQQFSQGMTSAIDRFSQSVAQGSNVFGSLLSAFRQFAADFLRQIAQMILQQMIFNLISGLFQAGAGSALGGTSGSASPVSALAGVKAHSGGVIGDEATYGANTGVIAVQPHWFKNARRYHSGGIAGLAPDEVPTVLERGEEVLTRADPRHRANGGKAGGSGDMKVTVVNTLDPGDFISKGLGTGPGERAVLNFIRSNSSAVKQALG